MADSDSFDIYGDEDPLSPSSPTQSGPKKRLRRERSSSAPPLSANSDDRDDDGGSTPRGGGKKVKEDNSVEDELGDEEDPFAEYDDHVFITSHVPICGSCSLVLYHSSPVSSSSPVLYSITIRYPVRAVRGYYPIPVSYSIPVYYPTSTVCGFVTVDSLSLPVSRNLSSPVPRNSCTRILMRSILIITKKLLPKLLRVLPALNLLRNVRIRVLLIHQPLPPCTSVISIGWDPLYSFSFVLAFFEHPFYYSLLVNIPFLPKLHYLLRFRFLWIFPFSGHFLFVDGVNHAVDE